MKQALLAITLLLAAAWCGGCGDPCAFEKQCPRTSTTVYGLDTVYYPYVGDFMNDGKIYTYKITVDGNTFIRSYKMTDFVHKTKVELDPLHSDDCKIYTSCDTLITKWYEMKCEEVNGQGSLIFKTLGNSFDYQFYDVTAFYRDGWEGYIWYHNINKVDTVDEDINLDIQFDIEKTIGKTVYSNVTSLLVKDGFGDTLQFTAYNKENGIINELTFLNSKRDEIKLLDIM
jgi:hypothetical protein